MEPKLVRKDIKYQKKTLIIVSILVISLFVGGSFALLSNSSETKDVVTFSTGNFDLEVAVTGILSLEGEVPKSYEDGFKNNDITLTLTNTGSLEIGKYEVKLEGDIGTNLETNYIRYSVSDDDGKTYLASKLLSETNNIIYTGYSLKTSKVLKLKLWIDEEAGEVALKKIYNGKIKVELYQNDDTLVDVVKSKLVSNYSGSNESFVGGLVAVNSDGNLYHETNSETVREYRYSGPTVNNYVTFNNELWRIVGVFKDENNVEHVKIVRNEVLSEKRQWTSVSNNDWINSSLKEYLNTEYYDTLSTNAKSLINEIKYYLGNFAYSDTIIESYTHERGNTPCIPRTSNPQCNGGDIFPGNQAEWTGNVALMYKSDYGYTLNSYNWTKGINYEVSNMVSSSWLQETSNHGDTEWILSPCSFDSDNVGGWYTTGYIANYSPSNYFRVRPCLYLKATVKIIGGTGEETNPFILAND